MPKLPKLLSTLRSVMVRIRYGLAALFLSTRTSSVATRTSSTLSRMSSLTRSLLTGLLRLLRRSFPSLVPLNPPRFPFPPRSSPKLLTARRCSALTTQCPASPMAMVSSASRTKRTPRSSLVSAHSKQCKQSRNRTTKSTSRTSTLHGTRPSSERFSASSAISIPS